jgi:nicotinamide-nucleotide amidase
MAMKIGFLHVGDELLMGDLDPYPAQMINAVRLKGAIVGLIAVVRDELGEIVDAIVLAEKARIDLLIITGGLGPTLDDITKDAVAAYLGTQVVVDPQAARWLEDALTRMRGAKTRPSEEQRRMATIPQGSVPLKNIVGAACGVEAKKGNMTLFCLPGFPNEMLPMFETYVLPGVNGDNFEISFRELLSESVMDAAFRQVTREYPVRISSLPGINWRREGVRIIVKGRREEVEKAAERLKQLLDQLKISSR